MSVGRLSATPWRRWRKRRSAYRFDQDGIATLGGGGEDEQRIAWSDLIEISITTKPHGFVDVERTFTFVDRNGDEIRVPADGIEQEWAARRMQRLEGFDLSKLDRALKTQSEGVFVLWRASN